MLREVLEQQGVKSETIKNYLKDNTSLKSYNSDFKDLYRTLLGQGENPMVATIAEVAGALLDLHKQSPSQVRNAYSAVLLIPGFEKFRFHPILAPYKNCGTQTGKSMAASGMPDLSLPILHLLLGLRQHLKRV